MLKKFLATAATVLLALGLSVVAVAAPASATHPGVSGTYACNPTTGKFDITWKVTGDSQYDTAVATILSTTTSQNVPVQTAPSLVGLTVQDDGFVTGVQAGVAKGTYTFKVAVQFSTHAANSPVDRTATLTIPSNASCYIQQDDTVDCTTATVFLNAALTNGNYINMKVRQNGVVKDTQAYVDLWQSSGQGGVANAGSGLVLRITKLDGTQTYLPITVEQKNSGILSFNYSQYITGPFTVTWVQFDGHNWHFGADGQYLNCGELPQDASAAVTTTQPTCEQGGQLVLGTLVNADWVGEPVITATTYSVTAKAKTDHLFPNGTDTLVLSGPLPAKLTGGVCDDITVNLTITYVPECAVDSTNTWKVFNPSEETVVVTYGAGQTHSATPGYSTLNTPRSNTPFTITWGADASGVKPGSATATPGSDLPGDDEECFTDPDVSKVVGACVYFQDGTAGNRTVTLTYDNEASALPVTFSLAGFQGLYDRTVPAGETVVVEAPNVLPAGGTYTVTAGDETFNILIDPCPSYDKPEPLVEQRPVASFDCDDTVVTVVTTTFTKEPIFNTETLTWGYGEWVEGESVTTTRAPLPEEITEAGCAVTVTDPVASTCDSEAPTELTSWIRIELNSNVEYRIDGAVVTTEYTSVTPGEHTVIAKALNGYTLESANPEPDYWTADTHTWTFTAADSSVECVPTLADVLPSFSYTPLTCTQAGSYTIGAEFGDVTWTVNGTVTPAGTYPVTTPGTIKLVASPTLETDTLNEAWDDEEIVLAFAYPDGACATPLALAMTGAATSAGVGWVGLLVVLTGLGLFFLRRKTTAQ